MSPRLTRVLTLVGALLVLGGVDYSIYGKERVIRDGETVYLELAPVDPRSLMQGDYMALRFRLAGRIAEWRQTEGRARLRTAPLTVDDRGVATLRGEGGIAAGSGEDQGEVGGPSEDRGEVGGPGEGGGEVGGPGEGGAGSLKIAFRIRGGRVWLGTNAYFFAEGTADRYEAARYGEFRVDPATGEAVLVGLRDAELNAL